MIAAGREGGIGWTRGYVNKEPGSDFEYILNLLLKNNHH